MEEISKLEYLENRFNEFYDKLMSIDIESGKDISSCF